MAMGFLVDLQSNGPGMIRIVVLVLMVGWSGHLLARLNLAIDLIYKTGLDNGLVLTSELHAVEEVGGSERIKLDMNNGPSLEIRAKMAVESGEVYGPPAKVRVSVKLFSSEGEQLAVVPHQEVMVPLGDSTMMSHQGSDGKLVEVRITPLF
jgi:hypothetical protein